MNDIPLWQFLWFIGGLVLLSALLSAAETALMLITEAKIRKLEAESHRLGWTVKLWVQHPQRILATLQIGDALVDVTSTVLASWVCFQYFPNWGVVIAVAAMTSLTLVIGKTIPKTIAKLYADQIALSALRLVGVLYYPFWLISLPISLLSRLLLRLTGEKNDEGGPGFTEEDLEQMINLGAQMNVINKNEGELLHSVLAFDDTLVREVMVSRTEFVALSVDLSYEELLDVVISSGHSRIPVYEENIDNIIGILHSKNLFQKHTSPENFELRTLVKPVFFVPETMKISALLRDFQSRRSHMAVVVDEFGGTAGLITLEDVLEEIVGDIQDEHDVEEKLLQKIGEGRFSIDARMGLSELEEQTGFTFPEQHYDTLGGLVLALAGKLPERGATFAVDGLLLKVTEADVKRVVRVEITAHPETKTVE